MTKADQKEWCDNCHILWEAAQEDLARAHHEIRVLREKLRQTTGEEDSHAKYEVRIAAHSGPGKLGLIKLVREYTGMKLQAAKKAVEDGAVICLNSSDVLLLGAASCSCENKIALEILSNPSSLRRLSWTLPVQIAESLGRFITSDMTRFTRPRQALISDQMSCSQERQAALVRVKLTSLGHLVKKPELRALGRISGRPPLPHTRGRPGKVS